MYVHKYSGFLIDEITKLRTRSIKTLIINERWRGEVTRDSTARITEGLT